MKVELKACPLCGSTNLCIAGQRPTLWVICGGCDLESGIEDTLEDLLKVWNTRSVDAHLRTIVL